MGFPCTVCRHPDRKEIDRELFMGEASVALAKKYGVSRQALHRHRKNHLMPLMAKAEVAEEHAHADSILARLRRLEKRAWSILDRSEKRQDGMLSVSAVREIRNCLELCAKLAGQIQETTVINVIMTAEWVVIQQALLSTLEAYPDARLAIASALEHVGAGNADLVRAETSNGRGA